MPGLNSTEPGGIPFGLEYKTSEVEDMAHKQKTLDYYNRVLESDG
jgi:hypothetical protein